MKRDNNDKPMLSIVPRQAMVDMSKALMFGAGKYSMHNWRASESYTAHKLCDSALRHIYAFLDGDNVDDESGVSHIGHAMANLAFLATLHNTSNFKDDRYANETCYRDDVVAES